jgi:hypothetical protein
MADTVFTRALVQAAGLQGSTQALASLLRVPEETLRRWMAGRAMMPVKAFRQLLEFLKNTEADTHLEAPDGTVAFRVGSVPARCAACQGTQFVAKAPAARLRYSSPLVCAACRQDVMLAELLSEVAQRHAFLGKARRSAAGQVATRKAVGTASADGETLRVRKMPL